MNASPWAVKKINTKCAGKQLNVYQDRLNEEAKILKGIHHPNIVGKAIQTRTLRTTQSRSWYETNVSLHCGQWKKNTRFILLYISQIGNTDVTAAVNNKGITAAVITGQ